MELLERFDGLGNTSVTLYYYEDSNDYVVTYHYTRPAYIAHHCEDIRHAEEMSTDDYSTALALYLETEMKARRHIEALTKI